MAQPKKQSSARKTGLRRSHLVLELAKKVNAALSKAGSSVRARTTKRAGGKKTTKAPKNKAAKK